MIKARKQQLQEKEFNPFETNIDMDKLISDLTNIDNKSIRRKFKATSDPIHLAFETLENASLKNLARDFIKESITDFADFICKICK